MEKIRREYPDIAQQEQTTQGRSRQETCSSSPVVRPEIQTPMEGRPSSSLGLLWTSWYASSLRKVECPGYCPDNDLCHPYHRLVPSVR